MTTKALFQPIIPPLPSHEQARHFLLHSGFDDDETTDVKMIMEQLLEDHGSEAAAKVAWEKGIAALEQFILLPGYTYEEVRCWIFMANLGYGFGLNAMETDFADYWDEIFERPFPVRPAINRDLRSELGLLRREICEGFGVCKFEFESPPMSGSMWPLHSIPAIPPLDTAREYEEDYLREQIAFCNEFLEDRKLDEVKRPAPAYYFRLVTFRNEQEIAEARFNLLHDLLQRQPVRRKAILMGTRYPEWFRAEVIKKGYAELPCIIDLLNHPPERGRDFAVNTFYPADYVQWLKDNRLYERPIIKPRLIEAAEIIDAMDYERGVTDVAPTPEVADYVARISRDEKERYYDYREEVLAARDAKKKNQ